MLRKALDICGIQAGEWFSVAAIRDREIRPGCFCDVAQAEAFLAEYAGWNQYLCGNPVKAGTSGKPKRDDVTVDRVLLVDLDPDPDADAARACGLRVAKFLEDQTGQYPTVVDSGRGTQLWVRVEPGLLDLRRAILRGLAQRFATPGVKFDATHNVERLMRLIGSVNLKTGRAAQVIHEGTGPAITLESGTKIGVIEFCEPAQTVFTEGPATPADMLLLTPDAKAVWDEPVGKGERSKRDFRFVLALARAKVADDVACRLLRAMPGSKFAEDKRGEDYWRATVESVRRHLAAEEAALERAKSLPERAKGDAGAPFEPASLDDLLLLRDGPVADWQRLRSQLKAAKVPIMQLERAMNDRRAEGEEVEYCNLRFVADSQRRIGWFKQARDGAWVAIDSSEARSTMRSQGQDPDDEVKALTDAPWALVNEPFQAEELEGRRWNKDGAALALLPEPGECPTWKAMLDHVGKSLDLVVLENEWCKKFGIKTGGEYLLVWIGAMLQRPKARCAYLFLHGPQEAGKSTLHEALKLLFRRGYVRANHALKSKEGFNGEIANAILCVVEEVDLSDPKRDTHERVKDWVTGEVISVRAMYRQAVDYANATHWIQCAQKRSFMPVLPGDTRITEIHVDRSETPMPKEDMLKRLQVEAGAFLHLALTRTLPEPDGRLFIPALMTQGKGEQADAARTLLEIWLDQSQWFDLNENQLASAFLEWLPSHARSQWDMGRVIRELPPLARGEARLAVALRGALRGRTLACAELMAALPPGVQSDWRNSTVSLGKALRRIAPKLAWLETVVIRGSPVWREKTGVGEAATPTQTATPTT